MATPVEVARAEVASAEVVPPRRGRPRSAQLDAAVLAATLDLAGRVGVSRMSVDEVADLAGVSKASIYRRWPSKEKLVLDALRSAMVPIDDVDTGRLADDLARYLSGLQQRLEQSPMNDVLPHLIEVACHDPSLRSSLDDWVQARRLPLRQILERGRSRGEVAPTVDLEVLLDMILAPFTYRRLLSHQAIDESFVASLLSLVLPALAPPS